MRGSVAASQTKTCLCAEWGLRRSTVDMFGGEHGCKPREHGCKPREPIPVGMRQGHNGCGERGWKPSLFTTASFFRTTQGWSELCVRR
jgi:hypothetical protein